MSYSPKTYKKCTFPKMSSRNRHKPIIKKKGNGLTCAERTNILKDWRDSWFKGHYESEQ